jgi:hypothetical protein
VAWPAEIQARNGWSPFRHCLHIQTPVWTMALPSSASATTPDSASKRWPPLESYPDVFSPLQEGSPSVGSWGASGDATFELGSGTVGPSEETTKSSSSGSGDCKGSLPNLQSSVGNLALDSSGWQNDPDASSPMPMVVVGDNLGIHGTDGSSNSNLQKSFCPDSLDDQTELLDEGNGVMSPVSQHKMRECRHTIISFSISQKKRLALVQKQV